LTILVGTSVPVGVGVNGEGWVKPDKAVHIAFYGALQVCLLRGLSGSAMGASLREHLLAFLGCVGFGMVDELHQLAIPFRDFDWADLLFDALGAGLSSCALLLLRRRKA